jgi:regulator of sirC expression with transglutaminase-like and TPR domain
VAQLPGSAAPVVAALAPAATPSSAETAREERRARRREERERQRALQAASPQPGVMVVQTRTVGHASAEWHKVMDAALRAQLGGDLDAAAHLYQRATLIEPAQAAGFRGLGLVAARAQRTVQARAALARYLVLAPDARDAGEIARRIAALR